MKSEMIVEVQTGALVGPAIKIEGKWYLDCTLAPDGTPKEGVLGRTEITRQPNGMITGEYATWNKKREETAAPLRSQISGMRLAIASLTGQLRGLYCEPLPAQAEPEGSRMTFTDAELEALDSATHARLMVLHRGGTELTPEGEKESRNIITSRNRIRMELQKRNQS